MEQKQQYSVKPSEQYYKSSLEVLFMCSFSYHKPKIELHFPKRKELSASLLLPLILLLVLLFMDSNQPTIPQDVESLNKRMVLFHPMELYLTLLLLSVSVLQLLSMKAKAGVRLSNGFGSILVFLSLELSLPLFSTNQFTRKLVKYALKSPKRKKTMKQNMKSLLINNGIKYGNNKKTRQLQLTSNTKTDY